MRLLQDADLVVDVDEEAAEDALGDFPGFAIHAAMQHAPAGAGVEEREAVLAAVAGDDDDEEGGSGPLSIEVITTSPCDFGAYVTFPSVVLQRHIVEPNGRSQHEETRRSACECACPWFHLLQACFASSFPVAAST